MSSSAESRSEACQASKPQRALARQACRLAAWGVDGLTSHSEPAPYVTQEANAGCSLMSMGCSHLLQTAAFRLPCSASVAETALPQKL